jgi:glutathione S-transferase
MSATNVVLRYFPIAGRAQPIRLALADANVPFEDVRVSDTEWKSRREDERFSGPYCSLPTLTWDDVTVAETLSIAAFVSRRLGHYEGLTDGEIAFREAACSNCYLEVVVRAGELIWADVLHPGAQPSSSLLVVASRILGKLERVEAQHRAEWLCGREPGMADFFAAEAVECALVAFGPAREAPLRSRLPRLFERRDRLARRPTLQAVRAHRSTRFTARPDEPNVLARLHEVDLTRLGL